MNSHFLRSRNKVLDLTTPQIMAIVNLTDDSFSDANLSKNHHCIIDRVYNYLQNGAAIIDLGAESTRPGASAVSLEKEAELLFPIIEKLRSRFDCWLSIDSYKPQIMQQAAELGADMLNDISGFINRQGLTIAAQHQIAICIMHMQGKPLNMQQNPQYHNVLAEIINFLQQQSKQAIDHGLSQQHIVIDPGFGFGKTVDHNYHLLANLSVINQQIGLPILIGTSRKSMLGNVINKPVNQRDAASLTSELIAIQQGAKILRVHNVSQTRDMLTIWNKTNNYR